MKDTPTTNELGSYLRHLRRARGRSLAALAAAASVSERSLSRWENGAVRPRLPELDQVLRALSAAAAERALALGLLGAARALRQQQREASTVAVALWGEELSPPGAGDLLRAMRHRRGLSLVDTAGLVAVQPSSISRWECSETLPAPARLEALLNCLDASPAERDAVWRALAGGQPFAGQPVGNPAAVIEALRLEFVRLRFGGMWHDPAERLDLGFLSLEARLWDLAMRTVAGRRLLAQVFAYHAFWLFNAGRLPEAGSLARRSRHLCEATGSESYAYLLATIISARCAAAGGAQSRARARYYLGPAHPWAQHPDLQAWAMSELGACLLREGDVEGGLRLAREARALMSGDADSGEGWHRKLALVRLLLEVGRGGAALDCLANDPLTAETPGDRAREALLWTEAHLAAGHRREAYDQLSRVTAAVRDHSLAHLRPDVDRLATRL